MCETEKANCGDVSNKNHILRGKYMHNEIKERLATALKELENLQIDLKEALHRYDTTEIWFINQRIAFVQDNIRHLQLLLDE